MQRCLNMKIVEVPSNISNIPEKYGKNSLLVFSVLSDINLLKAINLNRELYKDVESLIVGADCTLELYMLPDCYISYEHGYFKQPVQSQYNQKLVVEDLANHAYLRYYSKFELCITMV